MQPDNLEEPVQDSCRGLDDVIARARVLYRLEESTTPKRFIIDSLLFTYSCHNFIGKLILTHR